MKTQEKSDREKALEWWNKFSFKEQYRLSQFNLEYYHRTDQLTGREIEQIWRRETQQLSNNLFNSVNSEDTFNLSFMSEKKEQVDFERLNKYIKAMSQLYDTEDIKNLVNFFNLLSRSSTFAHKAHKELNKLN